MTGHKFTLIAAALLILILAAAYLAGGWLADTLPDPFQNRFTPPAQQPALDGSTLEVVALDLDPLGLGYTERYYITLLDLDIALAEQRDTLMLASVAGGDLIFEGTRAELLATIVDTITVSRE